MPTVEKLLKPILMKAQVADELAEVLREVTLPEHAQSCAGEFGTRKCDCYHPEARAVLSKYEELSK